MTKNELKELITEMVRDEIESLNESATWDIKEKYFEDNEEYYNAIKKDKKYLEKIFNKCSEEAFIKFKDKMLKYKNYEKDIEQMYKNNKKAPVVKKFSCETDYIEFCFDLKNTNHDLQLFYQDMVVSIINKNDELRSRGYSVSSEDYIGIYIHKN